jgi:hypothetical protein
MSKLPQLNLRIPTDYHQLIRDIAQRLRERDAASFAHELDAFLIGLPHSPQAAVASDLAARVDALEARLAELEGWRQKLADPEPEPPYEPAPEVIERARNEYIPEGICSKAHGLKRQGMTWEAVWKALGEPATVNGLRNAVSKWRKRYHVKAED